MKKTVLITGANGFLGRTVQAQLRSNWSSLKLLSPTSKVIDKDTSANVSFFFDTKTLPIGTENSPLAVLHLAAKIPYGSDVSIYELENVNVELVAELVKKYPHARHILASSVSVFGEPSSLPLSIESPTSAVTPYARTKLAAERIIAACPNFAIIRFSSLIGEGMHAETFLPRILKAARSGKINIFGDGSRLQNYLSINDAADMCIRALDDSNNFLTLGIGSRSFTNLEVANFVADKTGAVICHVDGEQGASYVYHLGGAHSLGPCNHSLEAVIVRMLSI